MTALVNPSPVNAETGGAAVIDLGAKRAERDTKRAAALVALHLSLTGIMDLDRQLAEAVDAFRLSPGEEARQHIQDLAMRREIMRDLARAQEKHARTLGKVPSIEGI